MVQGRHQYLQRELRSCRGAQSLESGVCLPVCKMGSFFGGEGSTVVGVAIGVAHT